MPITIDRLVDGHVQLAALVRPATTPRIAPDPDDDVVIGTALAARADLIATRDKLLLSVAAHQGVRIVGVAQSIGIIEASSEAQSDDPTRQPDLR